MIDTTRKHPRHFFSDVLHLKLLPLCILFLFSSHSVFARNGVEMHFRGAINTKNIIYMRLVQTSDDSLHGEYMYLTGGTWIPVKGSCKSGRCNFSEYNDPQNSSRITGTFIGGIKDTSLNGMWLSPDSSKFYRFELSQSGSSIESYKTRKIVTLPEGAPDSIAVVEAFAPKLMRLEDEKLRQSINTFLEKEMSEYSYSQRLPSFEFVAENSYTVHYISNLLLSISSRGEDNSGGVHPNTHSLMTTINLKTGKPLKFKECFKPASLKKINTIINDALAKCGVDDDTRKGATLKPTSENFCVDAYRVTFDITNVLRQGEQQCAHVDILLKDLTDSIDPKGTFKMFLLLW